MLHVRLQRIYIACWGKWTITRSNVTSWRESMTNDKSRDHVIPLAPVVRLIRSTTYPARVSKGAAKELASILENIGIDLAMRAADLAKHANRKTVQDADIKLANKQWQE
ncbi:MAG TPA: histone family protein [Candidatus Lokiarchaeia archaeon]|nr:histone family protein [Candidatus Lokiarchaeia archaeon]